MDKKKFIIILCSSIGLLILSLVLYFTVGTNNSDDPSKNKSAELKRYEALYNLELVEDEVEDYYVITGLTMMNQRGENSSNTVSFPKTIDNIKVKKIISSISFTDYKYIEKIIIPEYVEYIGTKKSSDNLCDEIFISCAKLNTIEVDHNNQTFSSVDGVLYDKEMTKLLLCPQNYISENSSKFTLIEGIKEIGNYAFYSNLKVVEITFNDELESIGLCAFNNATLLKTINFSTLSSLISIGNAAFNNCDSLVKVNLPTSVVKLGATSFGNCNNLKELFIPSSVTTFGNEILGGSLSTTVITTTDNLEFLKSMCLQLGIKNKDKDLRIIVK